MVRVARRTFGTFLALGLVAAVLAFPVFQSGMAVHPDQIAAAEEAAEQGGWVNYDEMDVVPVNPAGQPLDGAEAGQCSIISGTTWCGRVKNEWGPQSITLIPNWGGASGVSIGRGEFSTTYYRDTDGVRVRSGQCLTNSQGGVVARGPVDVKIVDQPPGGFRTFGARSC